MERPLADGGGFVLKVFRHPCFWAENGGWYVGRDKKTHFLTTKDEKKHKKRKKRKKREKNDTFLTKKAHKISHPIQKLLSMLKWVRFCGAKFPSQN